MYDGPVVDAFLHAPWIGEPGGPPRADDVPWTDDPRLRRVMHTFHHATQQGATVTRLSVPAVLAAMDAQGVAAGILAAKAYYPTTPDRLDALHAALAAAASASAGRLRWLATVLPPEHGPGSYWDLMRSPRTIQALHGDPSLVGVHITPSPWGLAPNDRWYYRYTPGAASLGLPCSPMSGCRARSGRWSRTTRRIWTRWRSPFRSW